MQLYWVSASVQAQLYCKPTSSPADKTVLKMTWQFTTQILQHGSSAISFLLFAGRTTSRSTQACDVTAEQRQRVILTTCCILMNKGKFLEKNMVSAQCPGYPQISLHFLTRKMLGLKKHFWSHIPVKKMGSSSGWLGFNGTFNTE